MIIRKKLKTTIVLGTITPLILLNSATFAAAKPLSSAANNPAAQTLTAVQQQDLATLKSKGTEEINRRITSLKEAIAKVNASSKLSSSDKTYLLSEDNTELTGLTTLETTLNSETQLSAARTDVQSIFSDYRVYALVLPKTWLVTVSDGEVNVAAQLTALSTKIQTKITTDKNAGKNVDALQTQLNSMIATVNSAQTTAAAVQAKVLNLQPSDYNSDHTILSGYKAQLQTVHTDNQTAYNDAKNIITSLKSL